MKHGEFILWVVYLILIIMFAMRSMYKSGVEDGVIAADNFWKEKCLDNECGSYNEITGEFIFRNEDK
tara:strand:+ start:18477 stop:18677 length:201 start_codon:yes stop_codon:yes gene_type:complete